MERLIEMERKIEKRRAWEEKELTPEELGRRKSRAQTSLGRKKRERKMKTPNSNKGLRVTGRKKSHWLKGTISKKISKREKGEVDERQEAKVVRYS